MKPCIRKLLPLVASALVLGLAGCDEVVLENPFPTLVDDRIVGSWATPDGKLAYVIRRGEGQSYESLTASDLTKNGKPTVFFLARAGGELFGESRGNCDAYLFRAPQPSEAPKGCWTVFHIVLSDNNLEYDTFSPMEIVKKSMAGTLTEVDLEYGVSAGKSGPSDADVLIQGQPSVTGPFLARYSRGAGVYLNTNPMHRIG